MDAVAESGRKERSLVRKIQIQPKSMDNEWADAGRDDRICVARPNSRASTVAQVVSIIDAQPKTIP